MKNGHIVELNSDSNNNMKKYVFILTVLKSYLVKCEFINYPTDILMIMILMIIKMDPPNTMYVHDGGITILYDGDLYIYGDISNNICANIGLEHVSNIPYMKKITNMNVNMIKMFQTNNQIFIFMQIQNDLYFAGICTDGLINTILGRNYVKKMQKIELPQNNSNISQNNGFDCTNDVCFVIFNTKLYYWDYRNDHKVIVLKIVESLKRRHVLSLKCDREHIFVLTNNGSVYFTSHNELSSFVTVNIPEKIIAMSCGCEYQCLLTENGNVYGWGKSLYYELENTMWVSFIDPVLLSVSNVKNIYCYLQSMFVITNDNELYACGNNWHGNLGLGHTNTVTKLTKVPIQNVENVACNGLTTFILSNDKIYMCGKLIKSSKICHTFSEFTIT